MILAAPVMVAEKSIVVRCLGQLRMIMSSSSLKPTSNSRSASSSTRIYKGIKDVGGKHWMQHDLDRFQVEAVRVLDVVNKTTGCGNDNVGPAPQLGLLYLERHACACA